ncbi:hypothetical protein R5W23_006497 [Gemmata sp. JC673]|uniref:RiboL-PSP-HEPN domain-containing protein n=1 Tax=Gemmata algarum TaxID=2975278 RepID=A0ABU5EVF1_9BACT|nr:hypothetical protein [Gemmata algarum]MDY3559278.1 hypothetical protein [Gemmata algarum]
MPSHSLLRWQTDRVPRLSALDAQVASGPPSLLTDENLRAFVAMLCAHFQGFCRDLYSESVESIVRTFPPGMGLVVRTQFMAQIGLGTGNPTLQTLVRDFDRFGVGVRAALDADPANAVRLNHLALLNQWRNFVVHHGVTAPPGPALTPALPQVWQVSCDGLAAELDRIMYDYLQALFGTPPW